MADIDTQRRSSNAPLWILAVIALLLLIWLLFGWANSPAATRRPVTSMPTATVLPDVHPVAGASHNVSSVAPMQIVS